MREFFVITEHRSETISSLLRWFFLVLCIPLFYYPPIADVLHFNHDTFLILLTIGIVYMTATQFVLYRFHEKSLYYRLFTRGGIVFDFVCYIWLMALTGGSESPFMPVGYLIVIHAALYWRLRGSFVLAALSFSMYLFFFIRDGGIQSTETFFNFFMKSTFLWLIALYGGIIASKERQYYFEKNMYQLQSVQDYLTGLLNHRKFQEDVLERTKLKTPFTLVLCDIDHFKRFNDAHGHVIGDEVLKMVGATFKRYLSSKDGTAYRYGGEEFAWIMNTENESVVKKTIEQVNQHLYQFPYTTSQNRKLPVTLSYGVAFYAEEDSPADIIQRADSLLYEAKSDGRNTLKVDKLKSEENQLIV
ncbi:GGDEF domain-containing protein [Fictibacillus nanhaiensis]|uniref:GGDEF domain-containing protein n=1 Tax=Fictibacillus nanhaiensis TaxID=742169 RepID=UPI001C93F4DF|nr:GGDEF domain-containing protein [Fictibacillus nanhaiensis]MBY6036401.1 GGDEF domain-containing protein [Fictibacillus nanhaiensis]